MSDPLLAAAPAPELHAEFDSTDARVKELEEANARLQQENDTFRACHTGQMEQKEKDRAQEARQYKERRELVAILESVQGRLLSETATECVAAAAAAAALTRAAVLQQELDCLKAYHTGQMEQKEKENQALVMSVWRERAAAGQERAAAILTEALLAEAKEEAEDFLEQKRFEAAARDAAEANTNRVQARLAKAEKVHPATCTLHPTP